MQHFWFRYYRSALQPVTRYAAWCWYRPPPNCSNLRSLHRCTAPCCVVMRGDAQCHVSRVSTHRDTLTTAVTRCCHVLLIIHTLHADAYHTVYMRRVVSCRSRLRVNSSMIQWVAGYSWDHHLSQCLLLKMWCSDIRLERLTGVHYWGSSPLRTVTKIQ